MTVNPSGSLQGYIGFTGPSGEMGEPGEKVCIFVNISVSDCDQSTV